MATATPAGQVLLGASVRVRINGQITTAGTTPVVTDSDTGLAVTLPQALVVDVRSDALPTTQGSVVRASINGNPIETLVFLPNNSAVLKWRAADGFHNPNELDMVQTLFIGPPPAVALPRP